MPIPINRIVAFAGPYISVVAGGAATWLTAKANVLGIEDIGQDNLATQIGGGLTFTLVSILSWLGQSKWLTGHHLQMAADAQVHAAGLAAPLPSQPELPVELDHARLITLGEDLPSDEDERAALPPALAAVAPAPPLPGDDDPGLDLFPELARDDLLTAIR